MSGGVDSSVAAALLKERGFHVVGVFMKPWQPKGIQCLWQEDRQDAMRVAAILDIPLETWDFSRQYEIKVTRSMIDGYRRGITPNPDVMCNQEIKFGLFFKQAMRRGADAIATGHYACIFPEVRPQETSPRSHLKLMKAKDINKDQTYFLWMLGQERLAKILFPIGEYTKPEVRTLARKFKLPTHDKKDSQGVCFIGPLDMKEFLTRHIKQKIGVVRDRDGRVLGEHDGAQYYTIGQRHGLDLGIAGGPYYVVRKDVRRNIVTVGGAQDLLARTARLTEVRWVSGKAPAFPVRMNVKIRYRTAAASAVLHKGGLLEFRTPQRAITPGQSAVFYKRQEVLGGGIIVSVA